jgi:hypothetical protein
MKSFLLTKLNEQCIHLDIENIDNFSIHRKYDQKKKIETENEEKRRHSFERMERPTKTSKIFKIVLMGT